jgi:hypothetical protein
VAPLYFVRQYGTEKKTAAVADRSILLVRRLSQGSVGTGVVPFNISPELFFRLRDHVQQFPQKLLLCISPPKELLAPPILMEYGIVSFA